MVRTSQGWVDASQGVTPGAHSPLSPAISQAKAHSPLPPATSQAKGQVRGSPGAGAGGDRTVGDAFPRRERRLSSRRGRGRGGASGPGNDSSPTRVDTPAGIGVRSGSAPRKCTRAVTVGGAGCSSDGGRDGDEGGWGCGENGAGWDGKELVTEHVVHERFVLGKAPVAEHVVRE